MTSNHTPSARAAMAAGAAALVLALSGCQLPGIGVGGGSGDDSTASATPSPTATSVAPATSPSEDDADGGQEAEGDSAGSGSGTGQVSYVAYGDVRYEAESMQCSRNDGGFEFGGAATGPYPGQVIIGGVFGVGSAEDPPDMAFVSFDAGQGGQWSAMTEVSGFSIGSLGSVSYDSQGASGEGTFAFHIDGNIDPATEAGSFEFFC